MSRLDAQFEQLTAASVWTFTVPAEHKFPHVLGVYSVDGMTELEPDNITIASGVMTVYFGVEEHAGMVKYTYEAQDPGTTTLAGDGGVVNVTVHQYNGGANSQQ